jgi:CO dehydrogenase maturation factor
VTIVDMEAGLELFGRGTPGPSDLLVCVVEPSLWSIQTATRIIELAKELGIPKVAVAANKIRDELDIEWIREALLPFEVEVAAAVPYDSGVSLADRKMKSLLDIAPESEAANAIASLVDYIEAQLHPAPTVAPAAGNGHAEPGAVETDDKGCPWVVDKY